MIETSKRNKGQGLIEFIVYLKVFLLFITCLFTVFYFIYSQTVINYQLQKTALCFEKFKVSKSKCKKDTERFLMQNLWFNKKQRLTVNKGEHTTRVTLNSKIGKYSFIQSKKIEVNR